MIDLKQGHVLEVLGGMSSKSVHCAVTSPPYLSLRDYGTACVYFAAMSYPPMVGQPIFNQAQALAAWKHIEKTLPEMSEEQLEAVRDAVWGEFIVGMLKPPEIHIPEWTGSLGLEPSIEMFVGHLVLIFRELKRVLRDDGTFWLNLSDTFQNKQLCGIPWRVALALQADSWILRNDNIWHKKAPMPSSAKDRCTVSHEYMFMFSKKKRYYFDMDAIKEPNQNSGVWGRQRTRKMEKEQAQGTHGAGSIFKPKSFEERQKHLTQGRHKRTVWTLGPEPLRLPHYAAFPRSLVRPCILAGTSERGVCRICGAGWVRVTERKEGKNQEWAQDTNPSEKETELIKSGGRCSHGKLNRGSKADYYANRARTKTTGWQPQCTCTDEQGNTPEPIPATVLDLFCGSGTTGVVAKEAGRDFFGIDLSPEYLELARQRINTAQPTFDDVPPEPEAVMEQHSLFEI